MTQFTHSILDCLRHPGYVLSYVRSIGGGQSISRGKQRLDWGRMAWAWTEEKPPLGSLPNSPRVSLFPAPSMAKGSVETWLRHLRIPRGTDDFPSLNRRGQLDSPLLCFEKFVSLRFDRHTDCHTGQVSEMSTLFKVRAMLQRMGCSLLHMASPCLTGMSCV